ncbi:hypothetical protein SAMN05443572_104235 [Myxococcus fulvus]|uniref:Lipoprotein n=1 Tax=Myxococcus fulvus TaxID=33 RepID=A0A511SZ14_MYXFU|nr:hypothetical protein [Myxococcus fulvus]GEN07140.1 hypothetical protein MFU01_21770 [Myxococcus fulvus]SET99149.1 hypothetical protein SAMN05443572_104235 [Myxococcus fulvus]
MRIISPLLAVVVGLTLSMVGCGGNASEPEQAPPAESSAVDEQRPEGEVTQMAICPRVWRCLSVDRNFVTLADCTAACGGDTCYRDYACRPACECP